MVAENMTAPGSPKASDPDSIFLPSKAPAGSPRNRRNKCRRKKPRETRDSSDEIMQTGEDLLRGVIQKMVECSRDPQAVALSQKELGGDPKSPPSSIIQRLIERLCRTGGDLDQNTELQSSMEKVKGESSKEVFFTVANRMFADGKIKWGRVTALFYFASKLAVKALCKNIPQVVKNIMGCAMEFLRSRLLGWIKDKGGWESLLDYFGINTGKTVADAAGKALAGALPGPGTGPPTGPLIGALIGAITGAVTGAAIGALRGALIGGTVGAVTGAVVGGLFGAFTTKKKSS